MTQNPSKYFVSNSELLKKHHREVWETINRDSVTPLGEVFLTSNGKPNLRLSSVNGNLVTLHDQNDPTSEIPQFLNLVSPESTGFVTLIGMGMGYTPLALLEERPDIRHLAVFELEPGIFLQAMTHMDLAPMLADPRLILSVGQSPDVVGILSPASRSLQLEDIHTLKHLLSFAYNPDAYNKISEKVFSFVNATNVEGSTKITSGASFVKNRFQHLRTMHHNHLFESLKGAFSNIPAILVAGGPSLDENIHLVHRFKNKAVIIAIDTVLPALLAEGVSPDFVTSIDPTSYEKVAEVSTRCQETSLVCMPWVDPDIAKCMSAKHLFWLFCGNNIEKWMSNLLNGTLLTGGAGTVAHLSLQTAIIMGCSPIVFIGQDLAYGFDKSHTKHAIWTDEDRMQGLLNSQTDDLVMVPSTDGGQLPTNRSFFMMKETFEQVMADNPGHYINSTALGAHLEGTEILPLEKVLKTYCLEDRTIGTTIDTCAKNSDLHNSKKLLNELQTTLKKCKTLQRLVRKGNNLSHKAMEEIKALTKQSKKYRSFPELPQRIQKKVREIENANKTIDKAKKIWRIVDEITLEGLRHSERMRQALSRLLKEPDRYLELLAGNLERLEYINTVRKDVLTRLEAYLIDVLTFRQEERKLLAKKNEDPSNEAELLKLGQLYFNYGEYVLAKDVLSRIQEQLQNSAEIQFYLGCIAAHQAVPQKADEHFGRASENNPDYEKKITEFRQKLGDQFYTSAELYRDKGRKTFKRALLKGLLYCDFHKAIRREIIRLAEEDKESIQKATASEQPDLATKTLQSWVNDLDSNHKLASALPPDLTASFYYQYGKFCVGTHVQPKAIEALKKALLYTPNDPDIHISLVEAFFAQENFTSAIHHLSDAVQLAPQYATYWDEIGDILYQGGNITDAIAAYEQCFISLPHKLDTLKKIGDCYRETGQLVAAEETYKHFKVRMEQAILSGTVP